MHAAETQPKLTVEQAIASFKILVRQYGLRWGSGVPSEAYAELARVNEVLDERGRRQALGFPVG